jgi:hypothetical protein
MSYLKSKSWFIKKTKKRPNRAWLWNENYQLGVYLLWPVTTETLKSEFENVEPSAKKKNFTYGITPLGARFLASGKTSCMAFAEDRPSVDMVAHECYHFTSYEMEYRGVPYKDIGENDDSEARAYFLQWAVRETAKIVKAKI